MFTMKQKLRDEDTGDNQGSADIDIDSMKSEFNNMKSEYEKMQKHNKVLLNEKKEIQKQLRNFDGLDADSVKDIMNRLNESEEARMIAEGKMDEVMSKRMERVTLDHKNELSELQKQLEGLASERDSFASKYNNQVINTELRKEAEASGMFAAAIDDALNRANGVFSLGENGEVEARDADGNLVVVDGKPLSPKSFILNLKESAAHYWPASESGGATGGTGKGGKMSNPFDKQSKDYSVTAQAKLRRENPELAAKMAAAANG